MSSVFVVLEILNKRVRFSSVFRCLEPLMKNEAQVFDTASKIVDTACCQGKKINRHVVQWRVWKPMHVTTWRISARHFLLGARTYELLMILWKYNLSTCFILIVHSHKPEVADAVILNSLLQKACLQRKRLLDQQTHDHWQEQSPLKILKIRKIKTRNRYNVWGFFFYPCGFSFFIAKRFLLKHDKFGCSLFSYLSIYHLSKGVGLLYS